MILFFNRVIMLFYPTFYEFSIFLVVYIVIYNLALFFFFMTLSLFIDLNNKTIYNLSNLKNNATSSFVLTVLFFSMAGVPPFLGFFSKLLILITLSQANFFFLYISFFVLLFFSLYFYIQNIRFLHSTTQSSVKSTFFFNYRYYIAYGYMTIFFISFFLLGFIVFDDIILVISYFCQ